MQKIEKALLLVANLSLDKKILDYRIEEILNLCDTSKVDIQGIIVQNIKKPLVDKLLFGNLKAGGVIKLNIEKGELKFLDTQTKVKV